MNDSGHLFTRAFVLLMASDMAYSLTAGALLGITPFFVTGPLGAGPGAVGLVVGAFSVTTLIIRPWAGRRSDQIGRRPLLVGGAALFAVLILLHLAVTGLWMLVLLRMLLGIAEGGYFVAIFAAIFSRVEPARRGAAAATASVFIDLALSLGPMVMGVVVRQFGFPAGFTAGGIVAVAGAMIVLLPQAPARVAE